MVEIHEGQVSVEQARAYEKLFPEMAIRSTYNNKRTGKIPVEYETLEEALQDQERYGSIWLHLPGGGQRQVAPKSEEEYLLNLEQE